MNIKLITWGFLIFSTMLIAGIEVIVKALTNTPVAVVVAVALWVPIFLVWRWAVRLSV